MSKLRKWLFGVLVVVVGIVGWRLATPRVAQHRESTPGSPTPVTLFQVQLVDSQSFNEFAGTVQSSVTVQISSRITAHIQELTVYAGAQVKKGDLLVRLDDGDIRARMKQAKSVIVDAEAKRDEVHRDLLRYQELVRNNIESRQSLDQAEARAKSATAAVETARQQLAEVKENLGYTEIDAPFAAVVVEKFAQAGDLASPGRILLTLQDPNKLRLEAPISEQCARRIQIGSAVLAKVASAQVEIDTRVSEIVPAVDPKSRSFIVRANLPSHADLKPGMFGRLRFPCAPRSLLAVPQTAIVSRGQLDLVFVVAADHAMLRLVRPGEQQDMVEILSGLTAGETVIADPPANLRDGDPVTSLPAGRR